MHSQALKSIHFTKWLDMACLIRRFGLSGTPSSLAIEPLQTGAPGILAVRGKHAVVNGTVLQHSGSLKRADWCSKGRVFIHAWEGPDDNDLLSGTSNLQVIDTVQNIVTDTINTGPGSPHTVYSEEMQVFLTGSRDLQAIDVRTKQRLFVPLESPIHGMAISSKFPYFAFTLNGLKDGDSMAISALDLRIQREAARFTLNQPLENCSFEIYTCKSSMTTLYALQSKEFFTLFTSNSCTDRFELGASISKVSRVGKHPSECFTWLNQIYCYEGYLVSLHLVSSIVGSKLAVLNATCVDGGDLKLGESLLQGQYCSRNMFLPLTPPMSRVTTSGSSPTTLAVAVDSVVYTAPIS